MNPINVEELARARRVTLDLYTAAYRVSGTFKSRFTRVAELLNQVTATHLPLDHATMSEYVDPSATVGAVQALIALDRILLAVAPELDGTPRPEMKINKRPVRAQLVLPPFRLTGTVHVPMGSRPADGLLNLGDAFMAMTNATISCATFPELERTVAAVAVRREHAHVVLVADDEAPDELLAEVLDTRTARRWLHRPVEVAKAKEE